MCSGPDDPYELWADSVRPRQGHFAVATCRLTTPYNPSVDYFPTKLASDYSAGWEVTYHNSYKVIDVAGDHKIVAYQCGTPVPTVEGATMVVQIPFTTVTLMSTSYIPFFELIGYRQAIKGVNGIQSVSSPCLRDAIAAGNVSNIGSTNGMPSISDINTIGADAVFTGPWLTLDGVTGPAIPVFEYGETTAIGGAEWLEYVALFLSGIADPTAWGGITNFTRFYEAAATADIWLYPSSNWDSISMDASALVSTPVEHCTLAEPQQQALDARCLMLEMKCLRC